MNSDFDLKNNFDIFIDKKRFQICESFQIKDNTKGTKNIEPNFFLSIEGKTDTLKYARRR